MPELPDSPRVVVLAGGVGGARMALGFAAAIPPERLTVIVNVADDDWFHGLRVCPDLDTVVYTLSGRVHPEQAWGVAGDSTRALQVLRQLGAPDTWMTLGDADIGLHLHRTGCLRQGISLTEVTRRIAWTFGVRAKILPVTDAEVRTTVETRSGPLRFQEWFVARRGEPAVTGLRFCGVKEAAPSKEALAAIEEAQLIVFAPSNPFLSILPMIEVGAIASTIRASRAVRIAVAPLIDGRAVKGPLVKLMADLETRRGTAGIVDFYEGLADGIAIDTSDAADGAEILGKGMRPLIAPLRIPDRESSRDLALSILAWASSSSIEPRRSPR